MNAPPSRMIDGAIWCSSGAATVLLVVRSGVVTDAPSYARKWALGQNAQILWRELARRRIRLEWLEQRRGEGDQ